MQKTKKLTHYFFLKKYVYIPFLGILLGIAISYFLMYSEQQESAIYTIMDGFFASICGVLIVLIFSENAKLLNKFFPYQAQTGNRLFIGFIAHFVISVFLAVGCFYLYQLFIFDVTTFFEKYNSAIIKLGIILLVLTLIFEVIYFALYSYYSYSKFQIETVKQERKQIELQLKALKSQLRPHFLFNSLNTISSLIYKNENRAEAFVRKLAKMYDFTLKSYHQKLITVKEELDFVESYIYLLQTRFQDKFTCKININSDLFHTKIPPLTLQMLVENAVKHNQLSIDKPLEINISSTGLEIIVENNITETPKNITSFNIGLKNINTRYLLLVDKGISIVRSEKFTVQIPIIK